MDGKNEGGIREKRRKEEGGRVRERMRKRVIRERQRSKIRIHGSMKIRSER